MDRGISLRPSVDPERVGRLSERIARFLGSWRFIGYMTAFIAFWILLNIGPWRHPDPFPFIFLTLLLSLQASAYDEESTYPFDVLGAQTEGMIGYLIEQELGNMVPFSKPIATILTMTEVDPDDPAMKDPTKFVGPVYTEEVAHRLAAEKSWTVKPDGDAWRRVVPSPAPQRIFEIQPIKWLLERGAVVVCTGGEPLLQALLKELQEELGACGQQSTQEAPYIEFLKERVEATAEQRRPGDRPAPRTAGRGDPGGRPHGATRRPPARRERHGLLLHLWRQPPHHSVGQGCQRPRTRLVKLAI